MDIRDVNDAVIKIAKFCKGHEFCTTFLALGSDMCSFYDWDRKECFFRNNSDKPSKWPVSIYPVEKEDEECKK